MSSLELAPNMAVFPIIGIEKLVLYCKNQPLIIGKPGASAIEHTKVQPARYYHYYSVYTIFISFYYSATICGKMLLRIESY